MTHRAPTRTDRIRSHRVAVTTTAPTVHANTRTTTTAAEPQPAPVDALTAARQARIGAERVLRRGEREQDQAARALEWALPPAIDEAGRERLRTAHAEITARVHAARLIFDRARAVEDATAVLAAQRAL